MTPDQLETEEPKIEIREAVEEDTSVILHMAKLFFDNTAYPSVSIWEPSRATETVAEHINSDDRLILLATVNNVPVGFLMALKTIPMWTYTPMGVESLFWVEPSVRNLGLGRLLKAKYKQWCLLNGCKIWCLGNALGMDTTFELDASLRNGGMLPAEALYVSKL